MKKGWKTIEIGNIAPARSNTMPDANSSVWNLSLDEIEPITGRIINKTYCRVSELGSAKCSFDTRHVLYSKLRPYLNKVVIPDQPGVGTSELIPMLPDPNRLDREFLAFYLRSPIFLDFANANTRGANLPRISMTELWKHKIPLPDSISEQRRIVARIKECMERVEEIEKLNAEKEDEISALRTAMLSDVMNKLKPEAEIRSIGSLLKVASGQFLPEKNMNQVGRYRVYGGNGVTGMHDQYIFDDPVIVIGRVGAKCGCVHITSPKSWVTDNALYVKEQYESFDQRFLAYTLEAANLRQYARQAAQPVISGKAIYPVKVLFLPIEKQEAVANYIEGALTSIDQLQSKKDEAITEVTYIREAILRKAFAGEL